MKKTLSLIMVLVLGMSLMMSINVSAEKFPALSSSSYCEFTAAKKMTVYAESDFSKVGTCDPYKVYSSACIDKNDVCYIYKITSQYAKVNYPTSSGRKTGYIKTKDLLGAQKTPDDCMTVWNKVTTYKYKNGDKTGYMEKGDTVYCILGNNYNVMYTAKSGKRAFKLAYMGYEDNTNKKADTEKSDKKNNSVTYAKYTGVNYRNLTNNSKRIAALDKAKEMVTVQWTAPCDFVTWASSEGGLNTVVAEDGYADKKFKKGKTYTGVPYSMNKRTYDDEKWMDLLNDGITTNGMKEKYSNYPVAGTKFGIDCSAFVCRAYEEATGKNLGLNTNGMLKSKDFKKLNSFSELKPGDIFLKSGHVMMFVGKSGNNYAVFESDAGDSKCSYNTYSEKWLVGKGYKAYKYTGFND